MALQKEEGERMMAYSGFSQFKSAVRDRGGVWASSDVYFSQFRDSYTAAYLPAYPKSSTEDTSIDFCHIDNQWTLRNAKGEIIEHGKGLLTL